MFARRTTRSRSAGLRPACGLGGLLATWLADGLPTPSPRRSRVPAIAVPPARGGSSGLRGCPDQPPASPPRPADRLPQLLTSIVREHIPLRIRATGQLGPHDRGLGRAADHARRLADQARSRKKPVNDGTWKRYQIQLLDPNEQFHVRVANVRAAPGGRAELDVEVEAALHSPAASPSGSGGCSCSASAPRPTPASASAASAAWACSWTSASCRPMSSWTRESSAQRWSWPISACSGSATCTARWCTNWAKPTGGPRTATGGSPSAAGREDQSPDSQASAGPADLPARRPHLPLGPARHTTTRRSPRPPRLAPEVVHPQYCSARDLLAQ